MMIPCMHAMHVAARHNVHALGSLCGEFPPVNLSIYRPARFSSLELRSPSSMYLSTCVDENLRARNPWTREIVLHALHRAYSQQYIVCTKYKYQCDVYYIACLQSWVIGWIAARKYSEENLEIEPRCIRSYAYVFLCYNALKISSL